jgi:hypothetical protein
VHAVCFVLSMSLRRSCLQNFYLMVLSAVNNILVSDEWHEFFVLSVMPPTHPKLDPSTERGQTQELF